MSHSGATHLHGSQVHKPRMSRAAWVLVALVLGVTANLALSATAFAGHSSTGKPAFLPCTQCHPVTIGADGKPTRPLPNGMKKHEITLEVHDVLGKDETACLVCHDDPTRNPGMLKTPDGSLVDITGDVSRVCQKCHFEKYREWQSGIHGKRQPKCTSGGCHDPHTPSWIYVPALPPFLGTGIEVRAVSHREPFTPLASPPIPPAVVTPLWLVIIASLGALLIFAIVGYLTLGRSRS
jgi:hypothetical protein